jgi:hypothetical protein
MRSRGIGVTLAIEIKETTTMLKREKLWSLTIEFWRGDLEARAKPTEGVTHRRHYFYFRHPPLREDFHDVCRQMPWTSVWRDTLFPILANHQWPMIDFMHKSAGVELFDQSKLVGRVSVYREDRWENEHVSVPSLYEDICKSVKHLRNKDAARRYVESRQYEIMEKVATEPVEIDGEIRRVLVEGGFLKGKRRKVTPTHGS